METHVRARPQGILHGSLWGPWASRVAGPPHNFLEAAAAGAYPCLSHDDVSSLLTEWKENHPVVVV